MSTPGGPAAPGASIGRSRHAAHAGDSPAGPRRCATCRRTLATGVDDYCNGVCRLKHGLTLRSPGRTAARRRRRRRHR